MSNTTSPSTAFSPVPTDSDKLHDGSTNDNNSIPLHSIYLPENIEQPSSQFVQPIMPTDPYLLAQNTNETFNVNEQSEIQSTAGLLFFLGFMFPPIWIYVITHYHDSTHPKEKPWVNRSILALVAIVIFIPFLYFVWFIDVFVIAFVITYLQLTCFCFILLFK